MEIQRLIKHIEIDKNWLNKYNKYVPLFIEEAKKGESDYENWNQEVFNQFIETSNHCVSSSQESHHRQHPLWVEKPSKDTWKKIAPYLKQLAEQQFSPNFDVYNKLHKNARPAASHRLIASLQPHLICTLVNESHLEHLYKLLNKHNINDVPKYDSDWYKASYNITQFFKKVLPESKKNLASIYPWYIYRYLHFFDFIKNVIDNSSNFEVIKQNISVGYIWVKPKNSNIGISECHYEICFDCNKSHKPNRAYVEVHFEGNNALLFNDIVAKIPNNHPSIHQFEWSKLGLRLNDEGYDFIKNNSGTKLINPILLKSNSYYLDDNYKNPLITELNNLHNLVGSYLEETLNKQNQEQTNMKSIQKYIDILKNNKNIILTGAPGTGKTFLAHEIANAIVGQNPLPEQIAFVQFHPSMDYTDFVEGLRPVNKDNSTEIGFLRHDGIFKTFCKNAIKNVINSNKSANDISAETKLKNAYDGLLEDIDKGKITKIPLRTGVYEMEVVGISTQNNILLKTITNDSNSTYIISFERLLKLSTIYKSCDDLDNITNIHKAVTEAIKGCHSSAYWATLYLLYKSYYNSKSQNPKTIPQRNYVFIIDEINRGEISKIFGELFFSIDPGYRGKSKYVINTQFQNLVEVEDVYFDGFYIPDNVYIIGTMNDIDRSVESMDFAIRRRFTWINVNPNERATAMGLNDDLIERMNALNKQINLEGFSDAYHIGPSYFKNGDIESIWNFNLDCLLREYLRGEDELEDKIIRLKTAFFEKSNICDN